MALSDAAPAASSPAAHRSTTALTNMQPRLDAMRRRVYLVGASVGVPVIVGVWWVRRDVDPFTAWAYPILGLLVAMLGLTLWRRRLDVARLERAMIVTVGAFWLVKFLVVMARGPGDPVAWLELQQSSYYNVMLFVAFAYLVYPTRSATRLALAAAALIAAGGAARLLPIAWAGEAEPLIGFVRYMVFLSVLIGVLHTLSVLKSAFAATQARAEALADLAYRDPLTGVANRRALHDALGRAMRHADRHGRPLTVLLFDLDHFKSVNDRFGHNVGDHVLMSVARAIRPALRAGDTFGRWGGEEFVVVAPDAGLDAAEELAERLRSAVAQVRVPDAEFRITASFGVTEHLSGETSNELIRRVDESLYEAKAGGRDRVVVAPAAPDPQGAVG